MAPDILWQGMLIYIQEVFWIGDQGEGTSLGCTLYFSDFRTSFSFSLWLGEWDHFTRRTETFQKISNMYGYFFAHIILHGFSVNSRWWGEGEWCLYQVHRVDRQYRVWTPQCAASWMLLLHMQEIVPVDFPLSSRGGGGGGGRHPGTRFTVLYTKALCKVLLKKTLNVKYNS